MELVAFMLEHGHSFAEIEQMTTAEQVLALATMYAKRERLVRAFGGNI
jgi:hypothetical protein|nr:MAG TPA: Protein of unknown function (DUF2774) [Caudoviricetes sp.]